MNTNFDSFVNYLTVFFDRAGAWFLTGDALARFVCAGNLDGCKRVEIGMVDTEEVHLLERMSVFGLNPVKLGDDCFEFDRDGYKVEVQLYSKLRKRMLINRYRGFELDESWIRLSGDELEEIRRKRPEMAGTGFWRRQVDEMLPQYFQLPYCYGTVLDKTYPGWFLKVPRRPYPTTGEIFFDEPRKVNGRKLIAGLYRAGEAAGIADRIFAGFGTMLGYLMFGDYIPKDRDMDMCILSDGMTTEQHKAYAEHAYNVDVIKPSRWEYAKREDDKYCWFSVGYKNPVCENGVKSCNWFFYSWNGYWWHSKGPKWVNPRKINQRVGYDLNDEGIGLGLPQGCITDLVDVDFNGVTMKIPSTPGMCADQWYPGWSPRGDGASAHRNIMIVPKWEDESTWRMA